jgi:gluconate 2-dehydrogenase subunit 3-like protein
MRSGKRGKKPRKKLLTANEVRTLAAVAARIFPPTDTPGAVEIGAVHYIERALAGDYAEFLRDYRKGLRAVDKHARGKSGKRFARLGDAEMDAVLLDFEAGKVPGFRAAGDFFETVRCHVLEGVFGEPEYGGNRGMVGWRLVGFPGQQLGYADPYINKRVDMPPVAAGSEEEGE